MEPLRNQYTSLSVSTRYTHMDDFGIVHHETSPGSIYTRKRALYLLQRALSICNATIAVFQAEVKDLFGSDDYEETEAGPKIIVSGNRIKVTEVVDIGRTVEWSIEPVEFEPGYFDDADGTLPDQNQTVRLGNFLHFAAFKI